jgi:deazaflavin-dependent oxidoreductase (nitroreductase family)
MGFANTALRLGNQAVAGLYRRTGGRLMGSVRKTPVLILTVPGRRSGEPRSTPVGYFPHDDGWLVVGSFNGASVEPDWFKNLRKAQRATIQIGRTVTEVTPEIVGEPERTRLYRDVVAASSPGFAAYEKKTDRVIPIALLRPLS